MPCSNMQLGVDGGWEDIFGREVLLPEPIKDLYNEKVVHISCGYYHNAAITGTILM